MLWRVFCWIALLGPLSATAAEPVHDAAAVEFFEQQVRPVLIEHCGQCHGPAKKTAGLLITTRAGFLRGGENGPIVEAGDPAKSRLIAAVRHQGDLQMPPESKLPDKQIAALEQWVKMGAIWPAERAGTEIDPTKHWAFQPFLQATPPQIEGLSPVDAFLAERRKSAGLSPAPRADRRTLIRRATMSLTGLLPTSDELAAFVADDDSQAYLQLVERLLASTAYGEHMARLWLDVARYADSKGYVYAREERFWVHAWTYRDWTVKAFNDDLPYDRFVQLQLAADQLVSADSPDLAAMGYLTLGRRFLGVTHDIYDDRIDVVTRGLMGLTVGCARCHDHKYDPIPTTDYYALYGVFQNCTEALVPLPPTTPPTDAFVAGLAERQKKLAETLAKHRRETANRNRARLGEYLQAQFELQKYPEEGFDQILAPDDMLPAFVRRWRDFLARGAANNEPIFAPWRAYAGLPEAEFAAQAAGVTSSLTMNAAIPPRILAAFATPPASRQQVVECYAAVFKSVDEEWQTLVKAAQERGEAITAFEDAATEALRQVLYGPDAPCEVPDEPIVTCESFLPTKAVEELWRLQGDVDRWIIQARPAPPYAVTLVDRRHPLDARVLKRGNPAQPGDTVPRHAPSILTPGAPQRFTQGSGRLELAEAITAKTNPLTARVIVNRLWTDHFGTGLVSTPSDFGLRAAPPSHPALLDWLARRFIEEGWSLKWLHRQILLSAAFQQDAGAGITSDALLLGTERDPENRLLWHGPSRRLRFEELRDALLQTSGLLDRTMGGPAIDALASSGSPRRTLYGVVDRQFLPPTFRLFDFANPDLHSPQRSETTVPQQALFLMNHPFVRAPAERLAMTTQQAGPSDEVRIATLFQMVLQRPPSGDELALAQQALAAAVTEANAPKPMPTTDWQYGYGAYQEDPARVAGFTPLPYFNGEAWQGSATWPDAKLGWVQLTATGGHPGNDRTHAAVRRFVAPRALTLSLKSVLVHEPPQGDGIRGFLVSSRQGLLQQEKVHKGKAEFLREQLTLEAGETLDFVVDIGDGLAYDQFLWEAEMIEAGTGTKFHSREQFAGQRTDQLSPWAQLAQTLLLTNEFLFLD